MIEILFKAKKFDELKEILDWLKKEKIERKHHDIKIRIAVGTGNFPLIIDERTDGQSTELRGITIDLSDQDI